jgi:hypothetical protein
MLVSPDLWVGPESVPRHENIVSLIYTCEGVPGWAFFVSRNYAREHRLVEGIFPMPDDAKDFGGWERGLRGLCDECFLRAYGGHFDEFSRWRPDARRSE